jgi:hypothetical protein
MRRAVCHYWAGWTQREGCEGLQHCTSRARCSHETHAHAQACIKMPTQVCACTRINCNSTSTSTHTRVCALMTAGTAALSAPRLTGRPATTKSALAAGAQRPAGAAGARAAAAATVRPRPHCSHSEVAGLFAVPSHIANLCRCRASQPVLFFGRGCYSSLELQLQSAFVHGVGRVWQAASAIA